MTKMVTILLWAIVYMIVSLMNTCLLILEAGAFSWNISVRDFTLSLICLYVDFDPLNSCIYAHRWSG